MAVFDGTTGPDNITGSDGDDTINGRAGNDTIDGKAGNDTIDGGEGDDNIDAGEGDDLILASAGRDIVNGGAGYDTLSFAGMSGNLDVRLYAGTAGLHTVSGIERVIGTAQADMMWAGTTGHRLEGGGGGDTLSGGQGDDVLLGGSGDDDIRVYQGGTDVIDGGSGFDLLEIWFAPASATVDLVAGTMTGFGTATLAGIEDVRGSNYDDRIIGDAGANQLFGENGADHLEGGDGDDLIETDGWGSSQISADEAFGGAGDDMIVINANDSADGGSGFDTLDLRMFGLSQGVIVDLSSLWTGGTGTVGTGTVRNFETYWDIRATDGDDTIVLGSPTQLSSQARVLAGAGNDVVTGGSNDNWIFGEEGNDTLYGLEGDDVLSGEEGADRLEGGAGDDRLNGGPGVDILVGGAGADTYSISLLPGETFEADEIVELTGDAGIDTFNVYTQVALDDSIFAGIRNVEATYLQVDESGNAPIAVVLGQNASLAGFDTITFRATTIDATAMTTGVEFRHDYFTSTQVRAGSGDDSFVLSDGNGPWYQTWSFDGGAGRDLIRLDAGSAGKLPASSQTGRVIVTNIETLVLTAGDAPVAVVGGSDTAGTVQRYDFAVSDEMIGAGQRITVDGGALRGSAATWLGNDREIGGGDDVFESEALQLNASALTGGRSVEIIGGGGNDILTGSAAADRIGGGLGVDTLRGGGGNDTFHGTAATFNGDTIADFAMGDRIVISDASLSSFTATRSGDTISFSGGGSLTLAGGTGRLVVKSAAEGGVELTLAPSVRDDFNGDGRADVLLRDGGGALVHLLATEGGAFASATNAGGAPSIWSVRGIGDFNGDGFSDLLWRHQDGTVASWLGQASGGFTPNTALWASVAPEWKIAGTGDYNGDGRDDILWRDDAGNLTNWLGQAGGGFLANSLTAFVPPDWKVTGSGDFNGDGRDDVLWRHETGVVTSWLATEGGGFTANNALMASVPTDWFITAVGDFNGDGRDDVLWRHETGSLTNWLGQANGDFTANSLFNDVPMEWQVAATGDYNGDGREDVLWRHETGTVTNWLARSDGGFVANDDVMVNVPTPWQVQDPAFDYF